MDRRLIWLAFALLALFACRRPVTPNGQIRPDKKKASFLVQQLKNQALDYEWFVAKAKAHFENEEHNIGFTLQLRQRRDSLTWLTVKKVSVEGARIRIRPDSLEILNHQENEYTATSFGELKRQYGLPLDFASLQTVLLGQPIWLDSVEWKADIVDYQHHLQGYYRKASADINLYIDPATYRLQKLEAQIGQLNLQAELSDYETIEENQKQYTLPTRVSLQFQSPRAAKTKISIHYNSISFEPPANTRFEIPEHYKNTEIPKF